MFIANSTPGFTDPGIGADLVSPIPGHLSLPGFHPIASLADFSRTGGSSWTSCREIGMEPWLPIPCKRWAN